MVTIGTDIEFFLKNKDGEHISSKELFPNNESIKCKFGIIERDGFAIEIQPKYSKSTLELSYHTQQLLLILQELLDKKELSISNEHCINVDIQNLIVNEDHESMIFGCKADMNSYTNFFNEKEDATKIALRTCGGHVHISIPEYKSKKAGIYYYPSNKESEQLGLNMVKWLDITLGLSSVIIDKSSERRKIYGKAGDFRYTKYGIEYRSLSNFFAFNPQLFYLYFKTAKECINEIKENPYEKYNIDSNIIISAINEYDLCTAHGISNHISNNIYWYNKDSFNLDITTWFI